MARTTKRPEKKANGKSRALVTTGTKKITKKPNGKSRPIAAKPVLDSDVLVDALACFLLVPQQPQPVHNLRRIVNLLDAETKRKVFAACAEDLKARFESQVSALEAQIRRFDAAL